MKKTVFYILTLILMFSVSAAHIVYADTDGTEPKFAGQAEQLILQLGLKWAGVEFELRTDAGVFPNPITVGQDGILRMELGGSRSYILSCLSSNSLIPDPGSTDQSPGKDNQDEGDTISEETKDNDPTPKKDGIPVVPIIIYISGLFAVVGALIAVAKMKNRAQNENDDEDYDDYDDE